MIESRTREVPIRRRGDVGDTAARPRNRAEHDRAHGHRVVVIAIIGLVTLLAGIGVTASGPPPMYVEVDAIFAISHGATAIITGGIGSPLLDGQLGRGSRESRVLGISDQLRGGTRRRL